MVPLITATSDYYAGAKAAAAKQGRLEQAGSRQGMSQEAGDTAAGQRSDDAAADADLGDAADAAAAQAALSRHDEGDKSTTGRSAGILGLSDDLNARSLVSRRSLVLSGSNSVCTK
jgi:hypothetical protein